MAFFGKRGETLVQRHVKGVERHLSQLGGEPEFASAGIFNALKSQFVVCGDKKQYEKHLKNIRGINNKANEFQLQLADYFRNARRGKRTSQAPH
ncbi:hypothetical protein HY993_02120 [Candidatus Micrarchaeota archaeon]|nr:hypothetical protein [Candidatus Micrarchaeota archaeon]